jgi:tetratricopeptide (TPR) repeat protein
MNRHLVVTAALWAAIALPGIADAQSAAHPWEAAAALVKATAADIKTGGLQGIGAHVADLEAALAAGQALPTNGVVEGSTRYVLADAGAPIIDASIPTGADRSSGVTRTLVIRTPYPEVAFYLGTYYDETGRFENALKALDAGLVLEAWNGVVFGELRPVLVSERGAALAGLKRWPEALANYEDGLKLPGLPTRFKATMQRGRGFALVELGRLDDGQAAYEESLKLEPGNARAMRELQYIARVKAGGPRTAVQLGLREKP